MGNSILKSVAVVKKKTGESFSDIRVLLDRMGGSAEDTIEIIERFRAIGCSDIQKELKKNYRHAPPLTQKRIELAQDRLGFRLPGLYIEMLINSNGQTLRDNCYAVTEQNSWADDHVCITSLIGIDVDSGLGLEEVNDSEYYDDWGYPEIGLVIGDTPASGHTALMLDYSECGNRGEPRVVYIDTARRHHEFKIVTLAENFTIFLNGLVASESFQSV